MKKRIFIIVMDSFGAGEAPDAARFGDAGSDTLGAIRGRKEFDCPTLTKLGLFNIDGIGGGISEPIASYGKLVELSCGKDTTTGHWELAGVVSTKPFPTFPDGFPDELIKRLERETGRKTICNKPYSGTEVIKDYGKRHMETGELIVYTSADSVLQIAACEQTVPLKELYRICGVARSIADDYGIGRVIARPFTGEYPFVRTANRRDFSLTPPYTMLDAVKESGLDVIAVGKISDIFAGRGIGRSIHTESNRDGMDVVERLAKEDFCGLCFVNLVDFDSLYGHRNDVVGYAEAVTEFDKRLSSFIELMKDDDLLLVTADHGCDPSTPSTDHSREYAPLLAYARNIKRVNLHTRKFSDVAATTLDFLGADRKGLEGNSFWGDIKWTN